MFSPLVLGLPDWTGLGSILGPKIALVLDASEAESDSAQTGI